MINQDFFLEVEELPGGGRGQRDSSLVERGDQILLPLANVRSVKIGINK